MTPEDVPARVRHTRKAWRQPRPMMGPHELRTHLSWLAHAPLAAAGMLLLVAMMLGGYAQGKGDALVHAVAVLALGLSLLIWRPAALNCVQKATFWILIAAVAVAALQLTPLPHGVFAQLPQRAQVLVELRSAGLDPRWLPMTLDRWGTIRAMLALLSFLAMWMLCTILPPGARIKLLKLAVAIAVPMALFGFAQASFKLDTTGAKGLFENRNHYATLLAMLLPFALAAARQARERNEIAFGMAWHAAVVAMLLAAALSFSRVGSVLAILSAIAALAVLSGDKAGGSASRRNALISVAAAAAAIVYFASDRLVQRFNSDMLGDLRWQYFENSWVALYAYLPWGSGLGSFRAVYAQFEPLQSLGEFTYANYAHNELLHNTIEGGLPALALMGAFVGIVAAAAARMVHRWAVADYWRRAALISVAVPLLHSLVDYPLRTFACSIVMALALAVLLADGAARSSGRGGGR